jgi:hypothetical protein
MRQGHTTAPGHPRAHDRPEFRPRRGESTDRRSALAAGLSLIALAASATLSAAPAPAAGSSWSHVVIVDAGHSPGPVLQAAFHRVAATGIGGNATAQVLKRLGDYIETEVDQRGKAALSIGLMVDATTAAKAAKWPAEDMARLVVALHRKFDPAQPLEWPKLQKVVERIGQGSPPDEILGTGDTLRETATRNWPVSVSVPVSVR